MGATPGGAGQLGLGLLKGGMTGLSQGLANYNNPRPQGFDFSQLQQGLQAKRKALGQGITPNSANQSQNNNFGTLGNVNGGLYG